MLVLDSLEDPQNVGTLLRSAEAAGVHGVVFPTRHQAPLTPSAVKASAGAVEHLLLAPVDDLAGALSDLHSRGVRIVGAEAGAPLTARQADFRGPLAIVVGSEGQGLSPAVRRRCDLVVRIPMRGVVGSLNAAVAGSVLLFEAVAQRDPAGAGDRPADAPGGAIARRRGMTAPAGGGGSRAAGTRRTGRARKPPVARRTRPPSTTPTSCRAARGRSRDRKRRPGPLEGARPGQARAPAGTRPPPAGLAPPPAARRALDRVAAVDAAAGRDGRARSPHHEGRLRCGRARVSLLPRPRPLPVRGRAGRRRADRQRAARRRRSSSARSSGRSSSAPTSSTAGSTSGWSSSRPPACSSTT